MTEDRSAKRRFLALHFPFLPAERLRATPGSAAPADAPFVIVDKRRGALRIIAASPEAAALGLCAGLDLANARIRLPGLIALPHDPVSDHLWLERIADACERYTPMVAPDPPDGMILDITGCLHGYADEADLSADAAKRLARWGMSLHHGLGDTPEAAQAFARFAAERIDALPVAALRLEDTTTTALRRAGLVTIGDLAARPTAPLTARFGAETTDALDRLLGRADSRITPRRPPPALIVGRRFAEPIAHVETVLGALDALIAEAAETLRQRDSGGRRFALRLDRSDGAVRTLAVETSLPTRDPPAVIRLFRERIETLADPLDPGFGFDALRLAVPVLEPLAPDQLGLDRDAGRNDALALLIDRLSTRLGRGRVQRFIPHDSHIPERAAGTLPAAEQSAPSLWTAPPAGEPPLRPIRLFDPPQPIEVLAEVPDGPPRRFRWHGTSHDVALHEGPERIACEWWRRRKGSGLTRDYYRIEDMQGRRYWIFRHGLYGSEQASPRWYVHGLFA